MISFALELDSHCFEAIFIVQNSVSLQLIS